jgi:guanosine-3',5'-bis(diphosphate) 3'-pyrophosphohydrolase
LAFWKTQARLMAGEASGGDVVTADHRNRIPDEIGKKIRAEKQEEIRREIREEICEEIQSEGLVENAKTLDLTKDTNDPEILYEELVRSIHRYHPSDDLTLIRRAFEIARDAHQNQKRKSGEPYIIHPIHVAIILANLELDKETIIAGVLHDVVEDTAMTLDELKAVFGDEVALLVDGVTKLTQLSWSKDKLELQAENLRKMFLAMAKDIRVILIKLADRLHNMRTLEYMTEAKQHEKATETMDIYAPLADRLGISRIKIELDDLCLRYLEPLVYEELTQSLDMRKESREAFVEEIVNEVKSHLDEGEVEGQVYGRVKHLFSIFRKMVNQGKTLDEIYDIFAIRILVDSVKDCYAALGLIHEMYKPIPGRFKDYIAMPKPNMYQSLHTTLIGKNGQPFEIQIRTYDMHRTAEYGIAAHWKYKEGGSGTGLSREEEKLSWLREILEWQKDMSDNKEFLSSVKTDFNIFSESVYCFTPSGDVKSLPNGSTPIDFAYGIHSAVGNKMVGARVNGKLVTIDYEIQNGDRIEIITSQNSNGPSRDWLKIAKSAQARNKINAWFKSQNKESNIAKGKELIDKYCKSKGIVFSDLNKPELVEKVRNKYGFRDWDSLLAAIGHGGLKEGQIINKMLEEYEKQARKEITDATVLSTLSANENTPPTRIRSKSGITVRGLNDLAVRLSKCCSPVPGDEIVGFVTRGRGVTIHRTDCINVMNLPDIERNRLIDAEWQAEAETANIYSAEIKLFARNRMGLLVDISKVFTERQVDIKAMNTRVNKQEIATISMSFETKNRDELNSLVEKLRQIDGIIDIERTAG